MSEVRERAEKMVAENPANNGKRKYMPLVRDLLAELERVENDTAKVKLAYAEGKITGRQQAAREAVEIVGSGGWYNEELEVAIKAHFGIKGE